MAYFKTLTYQNFQSVGNAPIVIHLDNSPTTLISGLNGSGKSTAFFALNFVLFGKVPSGAKLGDIINSVNKGKLLTELEFEQKGKEYKVIRGEKPKKFEIYEDGKLIDKDAKSKDYQKTLENILGFDYKLFTQVIMLNKERYEPFMELKPQDRRKVIEDILDISIFSNMNDILRDKTTDGKNEIRSKETKLSNLKTKVEGQNRLVQQIKNQIEKSNVDNTNEINEINKEIESLVSEYDDIESQLKSNKFSNKKKDKLSSMIKELSEYKFEANSKIKDSKKGTKFFESNDVCSVCLQSITDEFKESKLSEYSSIEKENSELYEELNTQIDKIQKDLDKQDKLLNEKRVLENRKQSIQNEIKKSDKRIKKLEEKSENDNSQSELDDVYEQLKSYENDINLLKDELEELHNQQDIFDKMKKGLSESGIKSIIVNEYINIINKKINEYLYAMNFYINITLDSEFNEKFHAPHKEKFTISNLSTGQKARVNIAIWLALLDIASIKNSVVSNVIVMDELLENIDADGVTDFMNLVRDLLSDKNVFIVTQRAEEMKDKFDSQINFVLNEGFTEIEEISNEN